MKAKQGKNLDARDMLANKTRILDARQQLQKIKNLKVSIYIFLYKSNVS